MGKTKHINNLLNEIEDMMSGNDDSYKYFLDKLSFIGMTKHHSQSPHCYLKHGGYIFPLCGQSGEREIPIVRLALKMIRILKVRPETKMGIDDLNQLEFEIKKIKRKLIKEVPIASNTVKEEDDVIRI
jgi:hypothetical protein